MYLRLDRIHKQFGQKVAVDHLSLEVPQGVIYGIIGPNGAGKTTTIRMIMDIIKPDSGTIEFDGQPVGADFKNRVGYLPEERGLYKKMTVAEVITYMAELKGYPASKAVAQIDPWLQRLELTGYRDAKVEELSKGMQQKLQFITTLMHEPDIIILDELFSGLDPLNMELMKEIIMDQKREGKTIFFSTHVMEQAEKLCDNVCMINKGQKVIDGKLSEVKSRFGKNSLQLDIEGEGNFIRDLPGVGRVMTESNNYVEVQLNEGARPDDILKAVVEKVSVRRFELVEPSLYSIFIDVAKIDPSELNEPKEATNV